MAQHSGLVHLRLIAYRPSNCCRISAVGTLHWTGGTLCISVMMLDPSSVPTPHLGRLCRL